MDYFSKKIDKVDIVGTSKFALLVQGENILTEYLKLAVLWQILPIYAMNYMSENVFRYVLLNICNQIQIVFYI